MKMLRVPELPQSQVKLTTSKHALAGLVAILILMAPITHAQEQSDAANDDQAVDIFIKRKGQDQSRRQAFLEKVGLTKDQQELDQSTRASGFKRPRPSLTLSAERLASLETSLATDVSQMLAFVDLRPKKVKTLVEAGFDPVQSAVSFARGEGTLFDQAILSDRTVVGKVRSIKNEDLGDGYGSTVTLDVLGTLVGRTGPQRAVFRQRSGSTSAYGNDFTVDDTNTYLISLSRGIYEADALTFAAKPVVNTKGRAKYYAAIGTRFLVDGDKLSSAAGVPDEISLNAAKTKLNALKTTRNTLNLDEAETAGDPQ
jgi:hypothetical protein